MKLVSRSPRTILLGCTVFFSFACTQTLEAYSDAAVDDGRALTVVLSAPPTTLDPVKITDVSSLAGAIAIHSPLAFVADDGSIRPLLAQEIRMAPDGMSCEIFVRPGQFWNGKPLTAHAIVRSIERLRTSAHPHRWILERIKGVDAYDRREASKLSGLNVVDDHRLKIEFRIPDPDFATFIASTVLMITGDVETPSSTRPYDTNVVGAGPFSPSAFAAGQGITLKRNEGHHNKQLAGAAALAIVQRAPNRLQQLRLGNADVVRVIGPMIGESLENKESAKIQGTRPVVSQANELVFLNLNWASASLSKIPEVERQALVTCLSSSIRREYLASSLYSGLAEPAYLVVPPVIFARQAKPPPDAQPLANTKGCPAIGKVELLAADDSDSRRLSQYIQTRARSIGYAFGAKHEPLPRMLSRLLKADYDIALMWIENQVPGSVAPWMAFFDERNPLSAFGQPLAWPAAAIEQARSTLDAKKRSQLYRQIAIEVSDQQQRWIPILSRNSVYLVRDGVQLELDYNGLPVFGTLSM